ncbi:DUF4442 domain-containing protein [uncultured Aquimarina sp.]|uniref:DUF4442 domain-containing protein n=1 Tax=uncultured Aquimarina sp. TaxID=575652 RepID=UPI00262CED1A|nr:DUF4442 domain-containing protein [uncultured Aquimarina sp.]
MSLYKKVATIGGRFFKLKTLFKYGFNYSPMYRRSTARVIEVSEDLLEVKIKLPISYKNRNYVNSIFGGSMFSAVDPIPMVQLINLLGDDYVVWDKSAEIFFKKPAKEDLYARFTYTTEELDSIKQQVSEKNEIEILKNTVLTNKNEATIFCEVKKTIYVANKNYYKQKRKQARTALK